MKPVNIQSTIQEVVKLLERTLGTQLRLELSLGAENHQVLGDPSQLQQVFLNLALNARDAMPEGGRLEFKSEQVFVEGVVAQRLSARPGPCLVVTISDTGCGIPKENLQRIFEPFFTTKPQGQGSGMGLAMVHRTVRSHGGAVEVESELGKGSRFRVFLPSAVEAPATAPAKPAAPSATPSAGAAVRILLIDDEPMVCRATARSLARQGYEVKTVTDPNEGVALFKKEPQAFDLILLDMSMPGMSGDDCFGLLRGADPDVRVILYSGYALDDRTQKALDMGCAGFLQKPFLTEDLVVKIKEVIAARPLRR
jgi:two-component system, cell cycle sensor histidine kinase and response regulator CckA